MLNIKSIFISRAAAPARPWPRAPLAYRLAHVVGRLALRMLFHFEITGRDHVPEGGPYIVVANHLNWLDTFAILLALPVEPQLQLVGWDGVLDAPKLARLIRFARAGFVAVARDRTKRSHQRRELYRTLCALLRNGGVLVLFPEGSVGHVEGAVRKLQPGFANLACSTGAEVLPVGISGTRRLWLRKKIKVLIGRPISPGRFDRESLVRETHEALQALLPAYSDPGGRKLFQHRLTGLIPSLTDWRGDTEG